jgi:signal transduction histidine kinase
MDRPPVLADPDQTRFDDRVHTAISGLSGDAPAMVAAWRQVIDLLCQPGLDPADSDMLTDAAMRAHGAMAMETRREAARTAAFGSPPAALVVLLANDRPVVAADMLATLALPADRWAEILPQLSPVARGMLRARRDLDSDTRVALASFGPVDFVLPGTIDAAAAMLPDTGVIRIADLVARIEAYRQTRQAPTPPPAPDQLTAFRFETDASGVIRWVDTTERAALVGISLIAVADGAGPGVDAGAMGAVRRRSAFRDARLTVASDTAAGGDWRISARPVFDDITGLAGYRGAAARAAPHQRAEAMAAPGMSADSLRQLVHELRTPLNAIGGFAELIERQLMGPVAAPYREAAGEIGMSAQTLIEAIDDLDIAARLDGRSLVLIGEAVSLDGVIGEVIERHGPLMAERGIALIAEGLDSPVAMVADRRAAVRLVSRLLGAILPLAVAGETLRLSLSAAGGFGLIALDRPAASDTGQGQGDPASLLGLDFSLRLIRNLAREMGGSFQSEGPRLTLSLPVGAIDAVEDNKG